MATYYVRTDGNNANAGTANTSGGAWLTIKYALAHIAGSDLLFVGAGTFVEGDIWMAPAGSQVIPSGSSGNPTRVVGSGEGVTIIQASFYLRHLDYFNFETLTIDQGGETDGNDVCIGLVGDWHNIQLIDVELKNAYSSNMYVDAAVVESSSDLTILRGSNHDSGQRGANPSAPSHGIYFASYNAAVTDVLLDGCELYNHAADPNSFAFQVYDANAHNLSNFTARNNIIHDCANGFVIGNWAGHLAYNNLVYDLGAGGGNGNGIEIGFGSSSDCKLYSNVLVNGTGDGIVIAASGSVSNCDAANNIIVGFSNVGINAAAGSGHTARTNLFNGNGVNTAGTITVTGSVLADPMFVDASGHDYRLLLGSPAIAAGTDLSGTFTVDIAGMARTIWDIGAYAFRTLTGTYISNFLGTENPLSEGGLWAVVNASDLPKKTSGLLTGRTSNLEARSQYTAAFGSIQSSEIQIHSLSGDGIVGVMTRVASGRCYSALWTITDGFLYLNREDTPSSKAQIAGPIAGPAFTPESVLRLISTGANHRVTIDDVEYIAVNDAAYNTGAAGIYLYYLSDPAEAGLSAWASTTVIADVGITAFTHRRS